MLLEKQLRTLNSETENQILSMKHEKNKVLLELDRKINDLSNKMTTETKSTERQISALESEYKQKLNELKQSKEYKLYNFQEGLRKVNKQYFVKSLNELTPDLLAQ